MAPFGEGLGTLWRLSGARSRSISAENPTGAPSGARASEGTGARAARELGVGWKVSPSVHVPPGETALLADIEGSGAVEHLWMTARPYFWRRALLRLYWDGDGVPAVEVPLGDFFCNGWGEYATVNSLPVEVNPYGGLNCYWPMPFRRRARLTLENLSERPAEVFYQLDYALGELPEDAAYFHARWRRSNPLPPGEPHPLLEGVVGGGHYVGTYLAWGLNSGGWWGEGEVKFYLDGDGEFPSICGTGTEDYFGGAWNFDVPGQGYTAYSTPFLGLHQILRPDGLYRSQQRFGMYRWHVLDPIRFERDVQALGWRGGGRYLPRQDDIASTCFWYARQTSSGRVSAPSADAMEVI